ncbi:heme ABC exporter ATP-binding protein CcmA [Iodidimonas gelatinilytica]|nr:heme ABC exporter ATP-binding protein CcmA [Iodidimonas gelatinilytica]
MMLHPTKHPTPSPEARATLNAQALACRRGQRLLFAGLDFSLERGRILILRGPNGSGKTSLLRLLAGLSRPEAGQLFWCGMAVPPSGAGLSEQVHYVGHSSGMKAAFSVTDNLRFWARYLGGAEDRLEASLEALDLEALAHLPVGALSAGQQRRVSLARLLVAPRPLWLLDEPTVALDSDNQHRLTGLIQTHVQNGGMAVIATHTPLGVDGASLDLRDFQPEAQHMAHDPLLAFED